MTYVIKPPYIPMGGIVTHGDRSVGDVTKIILHTTGNLDSFTLRDLRNFFADANRGVTTGAHFGVDVTGRISQMASVTKICWAVASHNHDTVSIEQIAVPGYSADMWLNHRWWQLLATAWTVARLSQTCNIPLVACNSPASHARNEWVTDKGVGLHRWCPDNDTDCCGNDYPFDHVLSMAQHIRTNNLPAHDLNRMRQVAHNAV